MDNVTISRIALLHPKVRVDVADIISGLHTSGVDIRIVQGYRTFAEQDLLWAQGRTTPGHIVTNAKGGQSLHNFGLALDFCLLHSDGSVSFDMHEDMNHNQKSDWLEVVNSFKFKGWTWGGDWPGTLADNDHVEKMFGWDLQQIQYLKLSNQVDAQGYVIIDI